MKGSIRNMEAFQSNTDKGVYIVKNLGGNLESHNLESKSHDLWIEGDLCQLNSPETRYLKVLSFHAQDLEDIIYPILKMGSDDNGKKCQIISEVSFKDLAKFRIFFPSGKFKVTWDLFIGVLTVYIAITLPMQIAFDTYATGAYVDKIDYLIDVSFFVDIMIAFNTAFFSDEHDAYVTLRNLIAVKYISTYFFIDVVSTVPFDTIVQQVYHMQSLGAIRLIKVIRLFRLLKVVKLIDKGPLRNLVEDIENCNSAPLQLSFIILKVLFFSHLVACLFWGLPLRMSQSAWFDIIYIGDVSNGNISLRNVQFRDQYVASLYWAITTLTTTGYGDILPVNNKERILVIFILLLGVSVFAYVTSNVILILGAVGKKEAYSSRMTLLIKEYVGNDINKALFADLVTHVKKIIRHRSAFDEDTILYRLPLHIRNELVFNQNWAEFENIALFRFIDNVSIKLAIFRYMKCSFAHTRKKILTEGEKGTDLIFLVRGKAVITKSIGTVRMHHEDTAFNRTASLSQEKKEVKVCPYI
jgi:hypothetical protein